MVFLPGPVSRRTLLVSSALTAAVAQAPQARAAQAPLTDAGWRTFDLGTVDLPNACPQAVDRFGTILGIVWNQSGPSLAALWKVRSGRLQGPLFLEGSPSFVQPTGFNARDDVVGEGVDVNGSGTQAQYLWRRRGLDGIVELPRPFFVTAVSADGRTVAGTLRSDDTHTQAAVWHDGVVHPLPGLGGDNASASMFLPDGRVVGTCELPRSPGSTGPVQQAVIWRRGSLSRLGTFGGQASSAVSTSPRGIVLTDIVLTDPDRPGGVPRAAVWLDGRLTDISPSGARTSSATAINLRGDALGLAGPPTGPQRSFLWLDGCTSRYAPFGPGESAVDIDDDGTLFGTIGGGAQAAVWVRTGPTSYLPLGLSTSLTTFGCAPVAIRNGVAVATTINAATGLQGGVVWIR